jgi:hypothetical protein
MRKEDPVVLIPTMTPVRLLSFGQRFDPSTDNLHLEPIFRLS